MTDVQPSYAPRRAPVQHRPGPPAKRRHSNSDGSPNVKAAIKLMIWGGDDGLPLTRQEAAKKVGIADVTLRNALANPLVLKHYNREIEVLRTGERPKSIHRIAELRDKAESERVSLEAAKYLDSGDKQGGITVNVGVGVAVQSAPGYLVDTSRYDPAQVARTLARAGSRTSIIEGDQAQIEAHAASQAADDGPQR